MSAWLVSKRHIDLMVHVAEMGPSDLSADERQWESFNHFYGEAGQEMTPQEIGAMLLEQNIRSLKARYPDDPEMWEQGLFKYVYQRPLKALTIAQALKAVHCYDYQACESRDWRQTIACRFCEQLQHMLAARVPGYDAAPWVIGEWESPPESDVSILSSIPSDATVVGAGGEE